jgi:hypothetical protein
MFEKIKGFLAGSKVKIIGIVIICLLVLLAGIYTYNKIKVYADGKAKTESILLTEKFDREDAVQALKEEMAKIKPKTIIKIIKLKVPVKTIADNFPSDCKDCLETIAIPYKSSTKYWTAESSDLLRNALSVNILPAYDDAVAAPCRNLLIKTQKELADSTPYHPIRLNAEVEAGYGVAGLPAEARIAIETGKKTEVSLGVGVTSNISPTGEVIVNPAITLRVERRLLPK